MITKSNYCIGCQGFACDWYDEKSYRIANFCRFCIDAEDERQEIDAHLDAIEGDFTIQHMVMDRC